MKNIVTLVIGFLVVVASAQAETCICKPTWSDAPIASIDFNDKGGVEQLKFLWGKSPTTMLPIVEASPNVALHSVSISPKGKVTGYGQLGGLLTFLTSPFRSEPNLLPFEAQFILESSEGGTANLVVTTIMNCQPQGQGATPNP